MTPMTPVLHRYALVVNLKSGKDDDLPSDVRLALQLLRVLDLTDAGETVFDEDVKRFWRAYTQRILPRSHVFCMYICIYARTRMRAHISRTLRVVPHLPLPKKGQRAGPFLGSKCPSKTDLHPSPWGRCAKTGREDIPGRLKTARGKRAPKLRRPSQSGILLRKSFR
jgi:hypothetical protein